MSIMNVSRIHTAQLEDIPELIHRIQSLLPAKEAARTCILSKSWLHGWSTTPTLRFTPQFRKFVTDDQKIKYQKMIDQTLQRYHRDNISIESLDLELHIQDQESALAAEKWIQHTVSKSCLKDLSLKIRSCLIDSFTLPNELFSRENLSTIKVTKEIGNYRLQICSNPFIKCVTLRVLDLQYVNISDDVLHNLLSACTLLEKIKVWYCRGLKNVLVKNLCHLRELEISSVVLEINNVPSLSLCDYEAINWGSNKFVPFKIDSYGSVTQLSIKGVIVGEDALLDIINSKFPVLERLALGISICKLESLVITSASLKSLFLSIWENGRHVNVQVHAPKLLSFTYYAEVHGLHFPTIAPRQIELNYILSRPLDISFFLKLWEVLNSSCKFDIHIESLVAPSNIDVKKLRRRCPFPVTNVQKLKLWLCKSTNEDIRFFDAFFTIFHPRHVMLRKLVVRKMMERQPTDLKDVELKNPYNGIWVTLTSSWTTVFDALADYSGLVECKLDWGSQ